MPLLYQLSSESEMSFMRPFKLCSTHYTAEQIKNCSKSNSVIKVATMKIWTISITQRKPSHAATTSTVSKDEWNTKKDTGKPMKNAFLKIVANQCCPIIILEN